MLEVLMTFEAGKESNMYQVKVNESRPDFEQPAFKSEHKKRVINFRKHKTTIDDKEVLIVIVKDCTDSLNFFKTQKNLQQNQWRSSLHTATLNNALSKLHEQVEDIF